MVWPATFDGRDGRRCGGALFSVVVEYGFCHRLTIASSLRILAAFEGKYIT